MAGLTVARGSVVEDTDLRAITSQRGNFVLNHGGVADYSGTPLYDGNDASRITFTDNSPMLASAIDTQPLDNGVLKLYFPAGHYGFAGDGLNISSLTRPDISSILIVGDGANETILDYVHENATITSAQKDTADILLNIFGIPVKVVGCATKCTTKLGVVHGSTSPNPDNPDVYNGATWFMHVQDAPWVVTEDMDISHSNYRGISVDGEGLPLGMRTKWTIRNCKGHDCTSTALWGTFLTSMRIDGCELYHNGTKGLLGTGYGVAASQYVDHVMMTNTSLYENYRKGFDRHGGVGSLVIANCTFADNILRDIEDNKQYNAQYLTQTNYTSITGSTFLLNRNPAWLKEALDAVQAAGGSSSCFKNFISILDRNINGTLANKQTRIDISTCTIRVLGGIPDGYQGFGAFNMEALVVEFTDVACDTNGFRFMDGLQGNVYQSYFMSIVHTNAVVRFKNTHVTLHPGSINHPATDEASNSVLLQVPSTTATVEYYDSTFEMTNWVMYGVTGGGNVSPANALVRKGYNTTFIARQARLRTQNQTTTNALTWFTGAYGLKGTTGKEVYQGCKIGFGDATVLAPVEVNNGMGTKQAFQVSAATKAIGATTPILLGALNGNVHVSMQGALEINADVHRSGFRYSSWTQSVYTGSSYVAFERVGTEAIKYNGADTNFIATKMQVRFAVASPSDTGYYNGEISCNDWASPLIIGGAQ